MSSASMRDPITSRILGACFGVYRELGWGFLENVYHRALEIALLRSGARVEREASIPVRFRGELVGEYKADLLVDNAVIVEVKTAVRLSNVHRAQVLNYLKATRIETGMLLNFGPRPAFERLVFRNDRKEPQPLRF